MSSLSLSRRKLRALAFISIAGFFILVCWAIWTASIFGTAPSNLEKELRSAKADGLPMDAQDLQNSTPVPVDQNAAPILKDAFAELKAFRQTREGKDLSKITDHNGGIAAVNLVDLAKAEPSLAKLSPMFKLLGDAASRPKLEFHRHWEQGPAMLLPELADEKGCVMPLLLKARIDLKTGRTSEALNSIDVAAKLSALTGQDPVFIALLVQTGMRSQICAVLAEAIKQAPNDPEVLRKGLVILNDLGPRPDIRPAMRSEFLMGRIAAKMLADQKASEMFGNEGGNTVTRFGRFGPVRTVYELRFIQTFHGLYRSLSENPDSVIATQKAFLNDQTLLDKNSGKDWTYGLADMIHPMFSNATGAIWECEATRNVLISSIRLLEIKRTSGKFPPKLPDVAGNWLDPFTEKPLIYVPSKTGFLIYSVGKDGEDNGGATRSAKSNVPGYDIPFSYP